MNSSFIVYNTRIPGVQPQVPAAMGTARSDQLRGTSLEILAELAGRICYDSLGHGRSSADWHKHVKDVGHLSVYEHCTFVAEFDSWHPSWFEHVLNKPSLFVHKYRGKVRIVANLRHVLEWKGYDPVIDSLRPIAVCAAPQVVTGSIHMMHAQPSIPVTTDEVWISAWLTGSRIFSHEQVRHGDWTAISQRSTRYVDESKSSILEHPLTIEALMEYDDMITEDLVALNENCAKSYAAVHDLVYKYLTEKKKEPADYARKQARSAATRRLPMGLETQMIFSASLTQWNHIFSMRCNRFADAEIAAIAQDLKETLYGLDDKAGA